ncbi:MAG: hypothetical protein AAFX87_26995 [Bacteroidota bacterium]
MTLLKVFIANLILFGLSASFMPRDYRDGLGVLFFAIALFVINLLFGLILHTKEWKHAKYILINAFVSPPVYITVHALT